MSVNVAELDVDGLRRTITELSGKVDLLKEFIDRHGLREAFLAELAVAKGDQRSGVVDDDEEEVTDDAPLTAGQAAALADMLAGESVFLTGGAGTGKSYVLRRFITEAVKAKRRVVATAPTGIAALNINGATLHRTFRIKPSFVNDEVRRCMSDRILDAADVLIIDEVSMCRVDIFDAVMDLVLAHRPRTQVILCGDFAQLAPVIGSRETLIFTDAYPKNPNGWAFLSTRWARLGLKAHVLTEIIRQRDPVFSNALNQLRFGNTTGLKVINDGAVDEPLVGGVYLTATNAEAKRINDDHMARLSSPTRIFHAAITGRANISDANCEENLEIKPGARVILTANDPGNTYRNGSMGDVVSIAGQMVNVRLDNGRTVTVSPYTWEVNAYDVVDQQPVKRVIGTVTQLPIRLGWAITIHKSQGQTYRKVNIVPGRIWAAGQMYVALSRATELTGIYLTAKLHERKLIADADVVNWYATGCTSADVEIGNVVDLGDNFWTTR